MLDFKSLPLGLLCGPGLVGTLCVFLLGWYFDSQRPLVHDHKAGPCVAVLRFGYFQRISPVYIGGTDGDRGIMEL